MRSKIIISSLLCAAISFSVSSAALAAESSVKISSVTAVQKADDTYDVTFTFNKNADSDIRAYYATYGGGDELDTVQSLTGTGTNTVTLSSLTRTDYSSFIVLDGINSVTSEPLSWDDISIDTEVYEYTQLFGTDGTIPDAWAVKNHLGGGMKIRTVDDAPAGHPDTVSEYALNMSASGTGNRISFARLGTRVNIPDKTADFSFDYYMAKNNTGSSYNPSFSIFSLGDAQRVSEAATDNDMENSFFALKESKTGGVKYYDYSSGQWKDCADIRDQWVRINISVDFENGTASFVIKDTSGNELQSASLSGVTAKTLNKIVMSGFRNSGNTSVNMWLDDFKVTGTFKDKTPYVAPARVEAPRQMEKLGRGVVALRKGTSAFIAWRSFATDSADTAFNVYRGTKKLNDTPITDSTNYIDDGVSINSNTSAITYEVRAVVNGIESTTDKGSFTLSATDMNKDCVQIKLKDESGNALPADGTLGYISDVWPGDFDNDGEYDLLVARMSNTSKSSTETSADDDSAAEEKSTVTQKIEAYKQDGTRMWTVDLGPNSVSGGSGAQVWGATQLFKGHWDGVTVYDLDMDGYAEVIMKLANGVVFGDGRTFTVTTEDKADDAEHIYEKVGSAPYTTDYYADHYSAYAPSTEYIDRCEWVAVLDGRTGALKAKCRLPEDYIAQGPLAGHAGIGYLDGVHPGIVYSLKNRRIDGGDFLDNDYTEKYNMVVCAFDYNNGALSEKWETHRHNNDWPDGHQFRMADVDGDGIDDYCQIGYVLNGQDGTLKYTLGPDEVVHGDRFYVGAFDTSNEIKGYSIEQDNPFGLDDFAYNAATGEKLWTNYHDGRPGADLGRGAVGDIDPNYPGFEAWSFTGLFNIATGEKISAEYPYPAFTMWWDGDLLSETFNDGKIEKWDPETESASRLLTATSTSGTGLGAVVGYRSAPAFLGDFWGDWREEAIMPNADNNVLIVATNRDKTTNKIYCLAQDPMYRCGMTIKGYKQNPTLDFYLGSGMSTPPKPNITTE